MNDALFRQCCETKLMKDGQVRILCKLGLWGVYSLDREQAERDARHYWMQYYIDGEYDSLLARRGKVA